MRFVYRVSIPIARYHFVFRCSQVSFQTVVLSSIPNRSRSEVAMTGHWRESARERIAQRQRERHRHRPEILEDRDELAMSPRPGCYPVHYCDEHDRGQLGPSTRYYAEPPQPYADELDDFGMWTKSEPCLPLSLTCIRSPSSCSSCPANWR